MDISENCPKDTTSKSSTMAPNSARKRTPLARLSRPEASPSHSSRMSKLFQDAAVELCTVTKTPTAQPNSKRLRTSPWRLRQQRFGHSAAQSRRPFGEHTRSSVHNLNRSELAPCRQIYENDHQDLMANRAVDRSESPPQPGAEDALHHRVDDDVFSLPQQSARLDQRDRIRPHGSEMHKLPPGSFHAASGLETDSDECHSTHGVRLIMPYSYADAVKARHVDIDAWLDRLLLSGDEPEPLAVSQQQDCSIISQSLSNESAFVNSRHSSSNPDSIPTRYSSNKENEYPSIRDSSLSSRSSKPSLVAKPPSRFRRTTPQKSSYSALVSESKASSPTSLKRLSQPPKRRHAPSAAMATASGRSVSPARDFTISEHELSTALAKLSPSIECHRKDRGPKKRRGRKASYWDLDILAEDSPAYPWSAEKVDQPTEGAPAEGLLVKDAS